MKTNRAHCLRCSIRYGSTAKRKFFVKLLDYVSWVFNVVILVANWNSRHSLCVSDSFVFRKVRFCTLNSAANSSILTVPNKDKKHVTIYRHAFSICQVGWSIKQLIDVPDMMNLKCAEAIVIRQKTLGSSFVSFVINYGSMIPQIISHESRLSSWSFINYYKIC